MEELIEVVDKEGKSTGKIFNRKIIHDENLLHKEVAVFIVNSKKQILLQMRSKYKDFDPNKWAITAGHVDVNEDNVTSLIRELKEELGIDVTNKNLKLILTMLREEKNNYNIIYLYYMVLDKPEEEFKIQYEEVSKVKWIDFNIFKEMALNDDDSTMFTTDEDDMAMIGALENVLNRM